MDTPPRNCPICQTPLAHVNLIGSLVSNHQSLQDREFALADCVCGLIYLSPAPSESDVRTMYADSLQFDQETYRGDSASAVEAFYTDRFRALLQRIGRQEVETVKILEVGAGLSWMCLAAKKLNGRNATVAQDISSEVVDECRWVDHYFVDDGMNCEIEARGPYDVVSMTHVIEHLVDPVGMLTWLRRLIRSDGLVFVAAPHRPRGWSDGSGIQIWREWSYTHVPAHVQYFSRRSMEKAARDAGFDLAHWDDKQEEGQAFEAWLEPTFAMSMINPAIVKHSAAYRHDFVNARPFPHVVIDDFFESDKAEQLLADFPPFSADNAKNEFGEIGRKAVVANISQISPFYAEVYRHIGSKGFLNLVSEITGIPDLVHDDQMFGGGTHENLEGQELDPHVDFNYIEDRKLHRRLNVLLYMNKEWARDWGGCLEIHSNPRQPKEDQIKIIEPLFNRCVIFETSERSWHGFEKICLPEGRKHHSRKLLSIYLYTYERPAEELAPPHSTFYVQRPTPSYFVAGHTLNQEDVREIENLCRRRDDWIEFYQRKELVDSRHMRELIHGLETTQPAVRVPLTGYALQEGFARGFWPDGWVGNEFDVAVRLNEPIESVTVRGFVPDSLPQTGLTVTVNGVSCPPRIVTPGPFSVENPARLDGGELLRLGITSDRWFCPAETAGSADARELVFLISEIRCSSQPQPGPGIRSLLSTIVPGLRSLGSRLRRWSRHRVKRVLVQIGLSER